MFKTYYLSHDSTKQHVFLKVHQFTEQSHIIIKENVLQ